MDIEKLRKFIPPAADVEKKEGGEENMAKEEFRAKKNQIDRLSEEINGELYEKFEKIIASSEAVKINQLIEEANDAYNEAVQAENENNFHEARLRYDETIDGFINIRRLMVEKISKYDYSAIEVRLKTGEKKERTLIKEQKVKNKLLNVERFFVNEFEGRVDKKEEDRVNIFLNDINEAFTDGSEALENKNFDEAIRRFDEVAETAESALNLMNEILKAKKAVLLETDKIIKTLPEAEIAERIRKIEKEINDYSEIYENEIKNSEFAAQELKKEISEGLEKYKKEVEELKAGTGMK